MDEELNPNLATGILVAGLGMVAFVLAFAFWQLWVLVGILALAYGGYHLVRTGKVQKPRLPKLPKRSRPKLPKLSRPKGKSKQPVA